MTTNTTQKAADATNANGLHTNTTRPDFLTTDAQGKEFATLAGHALHRTDPNDGTVTYWAERWGLVRYLPNIDRARQFLEQIGGRL